MSGFWYALNNFYVRIFICNNNNYIWDEGYSANNRMVPWKKQVQFYQEVILDSKYGAMNAIVNYPKIPHPFPTLHERQSREFYEDVGELCGGVVYEEDPANPNDFCVQEGKTTFARVSFEDLGDIFKKAVEPYYRRLEEPYDFFEGNNLHCTSIDPNGIDKYSPLLPPHGCEAPQEYFFLIPDSRMIDYPCSVQVNECSLVLKIFDKLSPVILYYIQII